MRLSIQLILFCLAAMAPLAIPTANAQSGAVYVATYVEVLPPAANHALALIAKYRDAARKDAGNMRFDAVQERGRPSRFTIIAIWKDQAAFDAHGKAAHTSDFRKGLTAIQASPYDERVHTGMLVTPPAEIKDGRRAITVVSHVDVPPPRKDECIAILNQLTDDSRKGDGNLRFEVFQQTSRPNHFTVVEMWKNKRAYEGHVAAAPTRAFRDKLTPMSGALYDERLYRTVE